MKIYAGRVALSLVLPHPPPATDRFLVRQAWLGKPAEVEALMARMGEKGLAVTAAEHAILIEAHGFAESRRGVDEAMRRVEAQGLAIDDVLYLYAIAAYGRCKDATKATATFKRMVDAGIRPTLPVYTALMKVLTDEGRHEAAWGVFQECKAVVKPDRALYSVALRSASALGGVGRMRETYEEMMAQGIRPDERVLNALIAGHCEAGDLDGAYEILDRMRADPDRRMRPGMDTYNVMIHVLGRQGKVDEAMELAQRARREGLEFDQVTTKSLVQSCGVFLPRAAEVWGQEGEKMVEGVYRGGREGAADEVVLDLHGLTVAECYAVTLKQMKEIRQAFDEDPSSLRQLVLITGIGRRSASANQSVIRQAVREFLRDRGLHFYHPPGNGGRIVVPKSAFRTYFERSDQKASETHFLRLTVMRYVPVGALCVMFFVLPRLTFHFGIA
jgi:pentatricopeptide repeat protein